MTDAADSGLGEQLLDDHFRLFVSTSAEAMTSNMPLRIAGRADPCRRPPGAARVS
jgi:hypothetical protein